MDDGISINVATSVIKVLFGGGVGAALMHWFGGRRRAGKVCEDCPEHQRLAERVNELEKNDAKQTALLESIDRRLETLTKIFMEHNGR